MKILKKWFDSFCWIAGINLLGSLFTGDMISKGLIIAFLIISGVFSIIPESFCDKVKAQAQKDVR